LPPGLALHIYPGVSDITKELVVLLYFIDICTSYIAFDIFQLNGFRKLRSYCDDEARCPEDEHNGQILSNCRPIQPLGTRRIYYIDDGGTSFPRSSKEVCTGAMSMSDQEPRVQPFRGGDRSLAAIRVAGVTVGGQTSRGGHSDVETSGQYKQGDIGSRKRLFRA